MGSSQRILTRARALALARLPHGLCELRHCHRNVRGGGHTEVLLGGEADEEECRSAKWLRMTSAVVGCERRARCT